MGDQVSVGLSLKGLARVDERDGEYARTTALRDKALAIFRSLGHHLGMADMLSALGWSAAVRGEYGHAVASFGEVLALAESLGLRIYIASALRGLGMLAGSRGDAARAARLHAAADAARTGLGTSQAGAMVAYERHIAGVRAALGEAEWAEASARGRALTMAEAAAEATAVIDIAPALSEMRPSAPATPSTFGLTPREAEILRLVAQGLGNLDIADRLSLSRRTIEQHLRNAYDKLGVDNRAAATRLVVEHGLA